MNAAVPEPALHAAAHDGTPESVFSDLTAARNLPTVVLGVTIMAVVTVAERALDAADTGFALEWTLLTLVALATFGLCARTVRHATRAAQRWLADYAIHARQTRDDVQRLRAARRASCVSGEMSAAQQRATLVTKNYRLRAGSLS